MAELNLWLDSYDDIYSDFDSRHYLKRRISEDFIYELRTEMKYKAQHTSDMVLLLPQEHRDEAAEKVIADSLTDFFINQFRIHQDNCRKKKNNGILLLWVGIISMLLSAWVSYHSENTFAIILLKVLFEPAGWFLVWTGLDWLIYELGSLKKERNFYKELSGMHVHFRAA